MSLISEFKEFAMRGNVVDLAVGVVIGAAFGKITASIVEDIFNPILGMVLGKVDFSNLYLNLSGQEYPTLAEAQKAGAAVIRYGVFINTLINFLIVAMAMFLVVKAMNQLRREPPAPPPPAEPPAEEKLLTEIRDLLKQNAKT